MVLSKGKLRSLQRQACASNDTEMFHKLINNQRRNKHQNTEILVLNDKNLK